MRNQWFMWLLVAAVGVFVLYIFNYQHKEDSVSLTEIFPDKSKDAEIEYEFIDEPVKEKIPATTSAKVAAPVVRQAPSVPMVQTAQPRAQSPEPAKTVQASPSTQPTAPATAPVLKVRQFGKVTEWTNVVKQEPPSVPPTRPAVPTVSSTAPAESPSPQGNVPYTIQIASFNDRPSAEVALRKITAAGYPAYIGARDLGDKGTKYRIYVGKYQTKAEANQSLSEVKNKYPGSFVISPKLD